MTNWKEELVKESANISDIWLKDKKFIVEQAKLSKQEVKKEVKKTQEERWTLDLG